ncbi:hypothetical protein ASE63_17780 [Bosea sp. Root381]|uniref:hypothetical protein n=1 Tax=Bosea sp. Root381 TaxID=1736524 RepID=UPI000701ED44|nr:hypothetical protein [Bosea sp. Root381]KRE13864.1 hypothetical protein ASE63_17780 [Bosea sp. Root381]
MPAQPPDRIEIRAADEDAGAIVAFPYDAALVERFRARFPAARWSDHACAWFVPGTTAERRVAVWLQRELPEHLAFADERGRDAFSFDPIESEYLEANGDVIVRTPYSRTVIDNLRGVPWAAWDREGKVWRVPYRSLEALRSCWLSIEIAARRAEPSERKRRREELKRSPEFADIKQREAERRRKRLAVPASQLPPPGRPVMTVRGIVVVTGSDGELVDVGGADGAEAAADTEDHVWIFWRSPTLEELIRTWPARREPDMPERARGWWQPTLEELREARRKAKSIERAAATRSARLA